VSTFQSFEDIEAWQKARSLTRLIYAAARTGAIRRDFFLADQLKRASISTMSNIAEGFERGGRDEFLHFLSIARASAAECQSHLYVAHDAGYLSDEVFQEMAALAADCRRLLSSLMNYLRNTTMRGVKYKRA
jgi:four helix bundle protein